MSYKTNQISEHSIEGGAMQELLYGLMKISRTDGGLSSSFDILKSSFSYLDKYFQASSHRVIEQKVDQYFLWNLEDPSLSEELVGLSDFSVEQEPFCITIDSPFLVDKFHLIFPTTYDDKKYFIGWSASKPFELDDHEENVLAIIHLRLQELLINYLEQSKSPKAISTIINSIPQSVVFREDRGKTWLNSQAVKLLNASEKTHEISNKEFAGLLKQLKDQVNNKEEVELIGSNMLTAMGALPSSFGEDWIWKFDKKALKVVRKRVIINDNAGELWVFDNVSELYNANERLNSLFRTLNVAYDEINANLVEFQSKSSSKKSITDLEAEESRIIQQYDDNDILGKVTHDLRTPFAKVYTVVQLLLGDNHENLSEQQVERIKLIKQIVADGLQIVKGFLSTDNMVLDDKKFHPEVVSVQQFINDNLVPYELLSARKNTIFITNVPNKPLAVKVDKTYLKRIIDNLVSNAIKFSPFESQITYNVETVDGEVIFSVKDNGPGLTEEDKTRLFKKYQQLSAKPIGTDETTGLGLYIVKTMVDKMKGKIWVESEHGKGANFKVSFPLHED